MNRDSPFAIPWVQYITHGNVAPWVLSVRLQVFGLSEAEVLRRFMN